MPTAKAADFTSWPWRAIRWTCWSGGHRLGLQAQRRRNTAPPKNRTKGRCCNQACRFGRIEEQGDMVDGNMASPFNRHNRRCAETYR